MNDKFSHSKQSQLNCSPGLKVSELGSFTSKLCFSSQNTKTSLRIGREGREELEGHGS